MPKNAAALSAAATRSSRGPTVIRLRLPVSKLGPSSDVASQMSSVSAPAHVRTRRRVGVPVAIAFSLTVAAIVLSVAAGARHSNVAAAEARMQKALAHVPQRGALLGKPSAPVTVYEFADLQCPYCANYMQTLFPK